MTQESPFELLLTLSRMQHRVPRRTVSLHPAQASQRPCDGPVSSHTTCWLHDTVEKSMPSWGREHQWNEPLPFATPSVSIPPWFSCRDTVGKSARLRVGSCCNPYPSHYRTAFAFSHPPTHTAIGWPYDFPTFLAKGARRASHVPQG